MTASVDGCKELVELLAAPSTFEIRAEDKQRVAYATGSLLNARALLDGMIIWHESGRADIVGVPFRSLYEMWLNGLLFLKGKPKHLARLKADDTFHRRPIAERVGANTQEGRAEKYPLEARAKSLAGILAAEDHPNANMPVEMYDSLYAAESLFGTHGGIGAAIRYVSQEPDEAMGFILDPGPDRLSTPRLLLGAELTYHLAYELWDRCGIDRSPLVEWKRRLPDWRIMLPDGAVTMRGEDQPGE